MECLHQKRGSTYDIDKEQWRLSSLTVFVFITEMTDLDCGQQWNAITHSIAKYLLTEGHWQEMYTKEVIHKLQCGISQLASQATAVSQPTTDGAIGGTGTLAYM